jgi:hypothetical protein
VVSLLLALDPGSAQTGYVVFCSASWTVKDAGVVPNSTALAMCRTNPLGCDELVYEKIASYGMRVGMEVFATVEFSGRCIEAWHPKIAHGVYRREVKLHLCESPKANDASIRVALLDRFGGSKEKAVGRKASPGPLYGVSSHALSALAVAVTWLETRDNRNREQGVSCE